MKIRVIEQTKTKLTFELQGESHTLCNALKEELRNDKNVKVASYFVSHPDIDQPTFTVESKDPKKCLLAAVTRLKKSNDIFLKAFTKELK